MFLKFGGLSASKITACAGIAVRTSARTGNRFFASPAVEAEKLAQARELLGQGMGIIKAAKLAGLGTSTVQKLKKEMMGTVAA